MMKLLLGILLTMIMTIGLQAQSNVKIGEDAIVDVSRQVDADTITITKTYTCTDGRLVTVVTKRTKTKQTKVANKEIKAHKVVIKELKEQKSWLDKEKASINKNIAILQAEIEVLKSDTLVVQAMKVKTIYKKK